ncbi:MAG: STAS domain-containing protein [Solirubrobacteraceae bacterium]
MLFGRPIGGTSGTARVRTTSGSRALAAQFDIRERYEDGPTWLALTGELDLATAVALRDRPGQARAESRDVRLDLSKLEFVDSSGMNVLVQAVSDARREGVRLDLEGDLAPQVRRMAELTHADHFMRAGYHGF